MDRSVLVAHLAMAQRHVAEGTRHVDEQRARVRALARGGHDTEPARALLKQFEGLLHLYIVDRDRLAAELAAADKH